LATAALFDVYAQRYDSWYLEHRLLAESEAETVKAALGGEAPQPCLEVGVGSGFFASRVGCTYGVDPSPRMLSLALERGVEAALARGEALPVAPGSLSAVLVVVTICFADDPERLIAEAARALHSGGVMVACIVPRDTPWGRLYRSRARLGHPLYSAARFYTVDEVERMTEKAGLLTEYKVATLSYPPWGRHRLEKPHPPKGREGFVCIRARKP